MRLIWQDELVSNFSCERVGVNPTDAVDTSKWTYYVGVRQLKLWKPNNYHICAIFKKKLYPQMQPEFVSFGARAGCKVYTTL